jgi:hypothetical protein
VTIALIQLITLIFAGLALLVGAYLLIIGRRPWRADDETHVAPRVRLLGLSYILVFGSAMVQIIVQPRGLDAEILGGLMVLGGLGLIAIGSEAAMSGLWLTVTGAVFLVAVAIERTRYRSEAAEGGSQPVGPGGGEPDGPLESRFQRTGESFVDPTSGHQMRVFVDPRTGERRYVAEG